MSSKSQKENQKKKERTSPVSLGSRPLSPAAATFDALSNPTYDTSKRMHSPPMPIPQRRVPSPDLRLHGLEISAPKPVRRTQSLEELVMRPPNPPFDETRRYPQEEADDFQSSLEEFGDFKSVAAPDEPLKGGKKRKSRRRSKKNSKKKSKKKSSKKSKKRSNKRFNKKSKKARR